MSDCTRPSECRFRSDYKGIYKEKVRQSKNEDGLRREEKRGRRIECGLRETPKGNGCRSLQLAPETSR